MYIYIWRDRERERKREKERERDRERGRVIDTYAHKYIHVYIYIYICIYDNGDNYSLDLSPIASCLVRLRLLSLRQAKHFFLSSNPTCHDTSAPRCPHCKTGKPTFKFVPWASPRTARTCGICRWWILLCLSHSLSLSFISLSLSLPLYMYIYIYVSLYTYIYNIHRTSVNSAKQTTIDNNIYIYVYACICIYT